MMKPLEHLSGNLTDTVQQTVVESVEKWLGQYSMTDLSNNLISIMQQKIMGSVEQWLMHHPMVHWLVSHPLMTVALLLVAIWLLSGFVGAIARSSEKLWLVVLRFPFQVMGWLLRKTWAVVRHTSSDSATASLEQQRLDEILSQLERLRTEEAELVNELKTLLPQVNSTAQNQATSLNASSRSTSPLAMPRLNRLRSWIN